MQRHLTLLGVFAATMLSGCKLAVISGEGGAITSASGLMDCPTKEYCLNNVSDTSFSETFTVHVLPGYEFVQWKDGLGFACGGSTELTCTVSLIGNPLASEIVASSYTAYVMPLFRDIGLDTDGDGQDDRFDEDDDNDGILDVDDPCPLDPDPDCYPEIPAADIVTNVNGRDWAQLDLFRDLNREQIQAACPDGVCTIGSNLNGYAMAGWRWATVDDFNGLLTLYFGGPLAVGGFGFVSSSSYENFLGDGWRHVNGDQSAGSIFGYLADLPTNGVATMSNLLQQTISLGFSSSETAPGWFYRETE